MPPLPNIPEVPLEGLYGQVILDHYRNPRHRTPLPDADIEIEEFNPFCGDRVRLQIKLDDDHHVAQVCAFAEGCSIIQASASMMADSMEGKTLPEMSELSKAFHHMMQGKQAVKVDGLEELEPLEVVRRYPVRIKCALLPWTALEEGIEGLKG